MPDWKPFSNADLPLAGIRVLSMEQAAALPFATRHLADLGAEVIRVQSHNRPGGAPGIEADLTRSKLQLAIDLAKPGGPEAFLKVAARCDVVAHNFTPKVMRRYGIDYEGVRAVNPAVIYVSLTGFGSTGPWGEKPLFGPGAEAVSGHNLLIGAPEAWPGRPGTTVYADNTCGLNCTFAILAALDERDRTGLSQHIDVSLYECAVSQLGAVVAERAFGSPLPERIGNRDLNYAVHGVFPALGRDRAVALAARRDQAKALAAALATTTATDAEVARAIASLPPEAAVDLLQGAGIAAAVVADSADQVTDLHLWARGFFGLLERSIPGAEGSYPHAGPAWGGGPATRMTEPHPAGLDSRRLLHDVAGMTEAEVDALFAEGASGVMSWPSAARQEDPAAGPLGIERGELARVDGAFDVWREARAAVGR
jgi:benzylsuccinate CoA-transferase BbsF subunit